MKSAKTHIFSDPAVSHEITSRIWERERQAPAKLCRAGRIILACAAAWFAGAAVIYLIS